MSIWFSWKSTPWHCLQHFAVWPTRTRLPIWPVVVILIHAKKTFTCISISTLQAHFYAFNNSDVSFCHLKSKKKAKTVETTAVHFRHAIFSESVIDQSETCLFYRLHLVPQAYLDELVELHRRLMALRERHILQQVINEEHVLSEVSFPKSLTPTDSCTKRPLHLRQCCIPSARNDLHEGTWEGTLKNSLSTSKEAEITGCFT